VYVDAEACGSFNAAFQAAAVCGDTINVRDGSYGNASTDVVINVNPVISACPSQQGVTMTGQSLTGTYVEHFTVRANNLTLRTFKTRGIELQGSGNVVDNFNGGAFVLEAANSIIENSDWGPCDGAHADPARTGESTLCNGDNFPDSVGAEGKNKINDGANNSVLRHNVIHDFTRSNSAVHFECIWSNGGRSVTVEGNSFYDCNTNALSMGNGGQTFSASPPAQGTWIFQNNICANIENTGCLKFGQLSYNAAGSFHMIIRFNSFGPGVAVTNEEHGSALSTCGSPSTCDPQPNEFELIGNIFGMNPNVSFDGYSCMPNQIYVYNIWNTAPVSGQCGGSATNKSVPSLASVYVNAADLPAGNYHLAGAKGTNPADNYVPASVADSGDPNDIDGNPRPTDNGFRDAGASDR